MYDTDCMQVLDFLFFHLEVVQYFWIIFNALEMKRGY